MTWNPFDWTAGPFLTLYVLFAATVFLVSFRLRSMIGPPFARNAPIERSGIGLSRRRCAPPH